MLIGSHSCVQNTWTGAVVKVSLRQTFASSVVRAAHCVPAVRTCGGSQGVECCSEDASTMVRFPSYAASGVPAGTLDVVPQAAASVVMNVQAR
jgi:hypothetical protein